MAITVVTMPRESEMDSRGIFTSGELPDGWTSIPAAVSRLSFPQCCMLSLRYFTSTISIGGPTGADFTTRYGSAVVT